MKRATRCAALALTLAFSQTGCETNLDGGGNVDDGTGGAGGSGAQTVGTSGSNDATTVGAQTVGTAAVTSTSTGAGGADWGGFEACSSAEGVPEAVRLGPDDGVIVAVAVTDDEIVYGVDTPVSLVRLDKSTGAVLERSSVSGTVTALLQDAGTVYGAGRCNDGGNPYVVDEGPSFAPLATGCATNPTLQMAFAPGGLAYEEDAKLEWVPFAGADTATTLATFDADYIADVASDGTDVFVATQTMTLDPETFAVISQIWRVPMSGDPPQKVYETPPIPQSPGVYIGGIDDLVVDDAYVYFDEATSGRIARVSKQGGGADVLWDGTQRARGLADVGDALVFVDTSEPDFGDPTCTTYLRVLPKTGGQATPIAVLPGYQPWTPIVHDGESFYVSLYVEGAGAIYRVPMPAR